MAYWLYNFTNTSNHCSVYNESNTALLWVAFGLGILSLIAISFTYQRTRLWPDCCWKLPGIVRPINLLTHSADHTINVILFAALSGDILIALVNQNNNLVSTDVNPYVATLIHTVLLPILTVLELCVKYIPLFGGVDCPIPLVGHVIALLYLPFLLAHIIVRDAALICLLNPRTAQGSPVLPALYVTARVPIYLAFLVVLCWFIQAAVWGCFMWHKHGFNTAMERLQGAHRSCKYYKGCVEHLLKRRAEYRLRMNKSGLFYWVCPCLTSPRKLPLRFTGAMTIATICLFQICLLLSGALFYLFSYIEQLLIVYERNIIKWLIDLGFSNADNIYRVVKEINGSLLVVLPVSPVVSLFFCFILMSHLTTSVYKNLLAASRGELNLTKGFSSFHLAASLRYAGYQIAFVVTAFGTYTLVLWVLGLIGAVLYFGFKYFTDAAVLYMSYILIPVAWIAIVVGIQVVACKIVFLKRGGGKFIIISNKRLFMWFTYFLFVYNAVVGLVSALLRVLISASLGLLLMLRLDRVILMKGFEILDLGHNAYSGFLHVEHAYNNPVVHVFVSLMTELALSVPNGDRYTPDQDLVYGAEEHEALTPETDKKKSYGMTTSKNRGSEVGSRRMRNRWLVAYTLVRNPSIQHLTASRLQAEAEDIWH